MKIIKLYFTLSALLIFSSSIAQDGQRPAFLDKMFVGGGFGASFAEQSYISVSPIIGYKVTPRLSVGLRLMYQYRTFDYYIGSDEMKFNGNDYAVGAFARLMVKGPFYLQAEYEHLNYEYLNSNGGTSRSGFDSFMVGGGMAQPIGQKAFLFFTAMYNFSYENHNNNSIYSSPYDSPLVIRIGITAGF